MRALRDAEFIRAARALGVTERRVLFRHALRNALGPVLTVVGVMLGSIAGGTVLVERVFDWPGMGRAVVEAVAQRDYPLVSGAVLVTSVAVVLATLLADLAVAWANPRLRQRL
jgi:ABC-type dipeptide/oligopeptide/nickel transport system permease component